MDVSGLRDVYKGRVGDGTRDGWTRIKLHGHGGIGLHLCVEGQRNYVIISYLEGDGE